MPPANSPSETPIGRPSDPSYLGHLSEGTVSVSDRPSPNSSRDEDAALDENIQFLRSTLAQLDDEGTTGPEAYPSLRRSSLHSMSMPSNITPSERETVRRLRRYMLHGGRATPISRVEHESRQHPTQSRNTSRQTEYQDWAPGSSDHENGELLMTFSDLRALARGYARGEPETATRRHIREQGSRGTPHTSRQPNSSSTLEASEQEMDWEPSRFLYTDANSHIGPDSSLRTTALLQSVRRQARFSPRPSTQSERASSWAERERLIGRQTSEQWSTFTRANRLERLRSNINRETAADSLPWPPLTRSHRARQDDRNAEASHWLEEAIKYLEQLRSCQSNLERMQSAAASGFIHGRFFLHEPRSDDFIMDTTHIPPPSRSSWLLPGSVFAGSQKSTSSITIPLAASATTQSSFNTSRHSVPSSIAEPNDRSGGTTRNSWINRVISRTGQDGSIENAGRMGCGGSDESWSVKVTITSVDYDAMTLTGTMEAFNVPNKASPTQAATIATYLEGEIIDFNRYTLETTSFNSRSSVDSTYWRALEPFQQIPSHSLVQSLLSATWLREELGNKYILMRWKEKCFITPADAQVHLTISGFYYVSLRRSDGRLEGLYYDPSSSPYQHLLLNPASRHFPSLDIK